MIWAPLLGPERQDNTYQRAVGYDQLRPSLLESIGAAVGEELADFSATGSLLRMGEMDAALGTSSRAGSRWSGPGGRTLTGPAPQTLSPIGEDEWKASPHFRDGLKYFDGLTEEAAAVLAERFDTRQRRDDVLARDDGGFGRATVLGASRIAAQLADPVGVAASFVPVVSQARFAALGARLGRVGARVTVGATEGAVGNLLLEPLVWGAAQRDQLDYTLADSLANVGMGAVFGAGLRTAGGAVVDWARARGPRAHTAAIDVAVRQAVAGDDIDVRRVLAAEDAPPGRRDPVAASVTDAAPAEELPAWQAAAQREVAEARSAGRSPTPEEIDASLERAFLAERATVERAAVEPGAEPDVATPRPAAQEAPQDVVTWLRTQGGVRDQDGALAARLGAVERSSRSGPLMAADGDRPLVGRSGSLGLRTAARRAVEAGYLPPGSGSAALVQAVTRTLAAGDDLRQRAWRAEDAPAMGQLQDARSRLKSDADVLAPPDPRPELDRLDPDDLPDDAPEVLLRDAEEALDLRRRAGRLTKAHEASLQEGAALVARAERMQGALRAAAACLARAR